MSKENRSICEINSINTINQRDMWVNRLHPLVKLSVTLFYMFAVVSFDRYDFMGILGMFIYPLIMFELSEISLKNTLYRLKNVLFLVCITGIFNSVFDREPIYKIYDITVTNGMISMFTLILKGFFTVLSSYLLTATTSIEDICYSLRLIHIPKIIVTQILLMYRYIYVLISEVERVTQAYSLRAPNQNGIHFKVWGSLAGQLLLRSMDRAYELYQSMCLRGYQGEFYYENHKKIKWFDILYLASWGMVILIFRAVPVFEIIGNL